MLRSDLIGYVPCHSSSIRGIKRDLIPKDDTSFTGKPAIMLPDTAGSLCAPTRRQFLKVGMAGAAISAFQLTGCGGGALSGGGSAALDGVAAKFGLYGFAVDVTVRVATELLRPALQDFLEKAFLPWVNNNVRPLLDDFTTIVKNKHNEFQTFLRECTPASWDCQGDDGEGYDNRHSDNFWYPPSIKCLMVSARGLDFKIGIGNSFRQLEPHPPNTQELAGMGKDGNVGEPQGKQGWRNGLRDDFKKYWETYRQSFSLLNQLWKKEGESEFKPEEVEYAVPLIQPDTGDKYMGFYINRNGQQRFLTTWH